MHSHSGVQTARQPTTPWSQHRQAPDLHGDTVGRPDQADPGRPPTEAGAARTPHPLADGIGATMLAYATQVHPTVTTFADHTMLGLRSRLTGEHLTAALTPDQLDELIANLVAARAALTPAPVLRAERRDGVQGRRATDTAA